MSGKPTGLEIHDRDLLGLAGASYNLAGLPDDSDYPL